MPRRLQDEFGDVLALDNVTYLPRKLAAGEMEALYASADALLMPGHYDNWLVVLEAMSYQLPVITTHLFPAREQGRAPGRGGRRRQQAPPPHRGPRPGGAHGPVGPRGDRARPLLDSEPEPRAEGGLRCRPRLMEVNDDQERSLAHVRLFLRGGEVASGLERAGEAAHPRRPYSTIGGLWGGEKCLSPVHLAWS